MLIWLRTVVLPFVVIFLGVATSFGQGAADPWLIVLDGTSSAITSATSRKDLVARYGATNVVDQDIDVGEGETEHGTVLFPNDPMREIEIIWKNAQESAPASLEVRGGRSVWKTSHGISLGTTLKELEKINGRKFSLSGFGWDYPGTVWSWEDGMLSKDFSNNGYRVLLRLDAGQTSNVTTKELGSVTGDQSFSSANSVMQKLNPRVYDIIWSFEKDR